MIEASPLKRKARIAFAALLAGALPVFPTWAASGTSGAVRPLSVEDALARKAFVGPERFALSPDGAWVAYTVRDAARVHNPTDAHYALFTKEAVRAALLGCDVWINNIHTGETRHVTTGEGTNLAPTWSPDGRYLAYLSDRGGSTGVWVWEVASGGSRRAATVTTVIDVTSTVRWTPDSRSVVLGILPEDMSLAEEVRLLAGSQRETAEDAAGEQDRIRVYTSAGAANAEQSRDLRDGARQASIGRSVLDIAAIDISGARVRRLVRRASPQAFELSPDGRALALLDFEGVSMDEGYALVQKLVRVNLTSAEATVIATGLKAEESSLSWSPDGSWLAFTTAQGDCYVVPASGVQPERVEAAAKFKARAAPVWDEGGRNIYLLAEGGTLWSASLPVGEARPIAKIPGHELLDIVRLAGSPRAFSPDAGTILIRTRSNVAQDSGLWRVDLGKGIATKIVEEDKLYRDIAVSSDGKLAIWSMEDTSHAEDLWTGTSRLGHGRRLTRLNPALDQYRFGQAQRISWHGVDGVELHGGLLLPPDYEKGRRCPLLVYPYGGASLSESLHRFGGPAGAGPLNLQLWATRGYAVLFPDSITRVGTPMRDIAESILPGIDQLIDLGIADPQRIGVIGHSYGGYSVLALIVQSNRFKAAVSIDGYSDQIGAYGAMFEDGWAIGVGTAERGQNKLGGSPWQWRDRFIENSPFFYLDRVQTPLLLVHGGRDQRVPAWLGDETFVGMRRLGKQVTYVKYLRADHSPLYWDLADQMDYCNRAIAWFEKYLEPVSAGNESRH